MTSGAYIAILRDHDVRSYLNISQGVELGPVPDLGSISDAHLPRIGDADGRPEHDTVTDFGAELAQQPPPPAVKDLRRGSEQQRLDDPPKLNGDRTAPAEARRQPEIRKVLDFTCQTDTPRGCDGGLSA